jgi:hypothetical protein
MRWPVVNPWRGKGGGTRGTEGLGADTPGMAFAKKFASYVPFCETARTSILGFAKKEMGQWRAGRRRDQVIFNTPKG